jgi:molybdate transport system ATP-binding protein
VIEVAFRHSFGPTRLDIAFCTPTPGVTVLFGPSGAGKSTIVAALAGLLRPEEARLVVDGAVLCDTLKNLFVPPERRRLGVVFQEARLFPHLSVQDNLRYGLRRAPPGPVGFARVIDLLGIEALLLRRPHTLSGGERQRVAIGRAVLSQPRLLLMDEPLASLDDSRRADILPFVAALGRELSIPIVYVTHAIAELAALADSVVLLQAGRVVAHGPLRDLSARGDLPIAARDDAAAVLPATILAHDPGRQLTRVQAGPATFLVPLSAASVGSRVRLLVPAADIVLALAAPDIVVSVQNTLPARVRALHPQPERHAVIVELDLAEGCVVLARITPDAVARLGLAPATPVLALLKATSLQLLA